MATARVIEKDTYYNLTGISEVCKEADDFTNIQNRIISYFNRQMNDSNQFIEKELVRRVVNDIPYDRRSMTTLQVIDSATDFVRGYKKLKPNCFTVPISDEEWRTFLHSREGQELANKCFKLNDTTFERAGHGSIQPSKPSNTVHSWKMYVRSILSLQGKKARAV